MGDEPHQRRLARDFFARETLSVARDLLGKRLIHDMDGRRLGGIIVETEAYCATGPQDEACHGHKNRGRPTRRTAVMFGPAGHAYVYLNYGIHWLFNVVTGLDGQPGAVLIRALEPDADEAILAERRAGRRRRAWTNGPGKLTQALGIDRRLDGHNLCDPSSVVWIEPALNVSAQDVESGPRIGLGQLNEPWVSIPWRFWLSGNPYVSPGRSSQADIRRNRSADQPA